MTTRRFLATCGVAFLLSQVVEILVHGFILSRDYAPFYGTLLRPMTNRGDWRLLLLPISHLSFVCALVWIYSRLAPAGPRMRRGLAFGVVAWMVGPAPLYMLWYAEQPWPGSLVGKQLVLELAGSLLIGLTIAGMSSRTVRRP